MSTNWTWCMPSMVDVTGNFPLRPCSLCFHTPWHDLWRVVFHPYRQHRGAPVWQQTDRMSRGVWSFYCLHMHTHAYSNTQTICNDTERTFFRGGHCHPFGSGGFTSACGVWSALTLLVLGQLCCSSVDESCLWDIFEFLKFSCHSVINYFPIAFPKGTLAST